MLKVVSWPIDKLVPYIRNPRKNDEQVDRMVSAIKEFGFRIPVVAKSDGSVVDGHLRLKAAQKLGLKEVPVALADELTDVQVKAFRLLANKSANWAEWDDELLKLELDELKDMDFDLELTGFDADELAAFEPVVVPQADEDEVPEVQENEPPVTQEGYVWLCGKHRVMCGDSTDAGSVALLMQNEKAEMLFTSPPYSDLRTYTGNDVSVDTIINFIPVYADYTPYQFVNLGIVIRDREIVSYWDDYIAKAKEVGYKLMSWCVWDKGAAGSVGQQKHFIPTRHEWVFVFGHNSKELNKTEEKLSKTINSRTTTRRQADGTMKVSSRGDDSNPLKTIESVVKINCEHGAIRAEHPAVFPVDLPRTYIEAMTSPDDIVIEPFGGSGTTLIACESTGRRCRMMEYAPKYCDVIVKRWQDYTGQKAMLEGDGRTFDEVADG